LDLVKANHLSDVLHQSLENHRVRARLLVAPSNTTPALEKLAAKLGKNKSGSSYQTKNDKWKLIINKKLELEK
jgi:hypothetical protein